MVSTPLGNKDLIRALNRSTVLNIIKTYGPIASTDIAHRTRLSLATVVSITAELAEDRLIFEKEIGSSSGGRRPILMALNPDGGFAVGIKLTERQLIGALTDLEATVVSRSTQEWSGASVEDAIEGIASLVNALLAESRIRKKQLLGVGVGLAGIIDARNGILRKTPYFGWQDLPLRDLLQSRLRCRVYIDNDVNTLTLAEKWFGAGQGIENFVTVTIGRGVGAGIVVNGQFYRGHGGGAGEFGHTIIDPLGPVCSCGKRGCLEAYIGDPALMRQAAESGLGECVLQPEDLAALAMDGNSAAIKIFEGAGEMLGRSLANLINILDPELIILSGEGTRAGNLIFQPMRQAIDRYLFDGLGKGITVHVEPWTDEAWARGAASLVLRELFESPVFREEVPVSI